jgi:hypothetical protein
VIIIGLFVSSHCLTVMPECFYRVSSSIGLLDSRLRGNDDADYFSTVSNCAAAASTNALNNGCGRLGRLLNSGWNCEPTING